MNPVNLTQYIIVAVVASLIVYDIVVFWLFGVEPTISRVMYNAALDTPLIVFAYFALGGHMFTGMWLPAIVGTLAGYKWWGNSMSSGKSSGDETEMLGKDPSNANSDRDS